MNEKIDLTKILKDCPKGWKLWSPIFGEVEFECILKLKDIVNIKKDNEIWSFRTDATFPISNLNSVEVMLYPSEDQRDWSKFSAPWYKKEKFDPKTLQPFDRVIVKSCVNINTWKCGLFSHVKDDAALYKYSCVGDSYEVCIPYNDDTKHLVGTTEEAPEYYRYWEN